MTSVTQINRGLAHSLNQLAYRTPVLSGLARLFADDLIGIVPLIVSRWWLDGPENAREAAFSAVLAGVASLSFNDLVGEILYVRRPYLVTWTRALVGVPRSSSFPSGHSTAAFSIAATALFYHLPDRFVLLGGAGLIALGRVCAGVHYPSDVLAGAAIGTFWAYLIHHTVRRGVRLR
jgi:undecaprenyl-diphosphatase